jgi:hypothetical protein
LVVLRLFLSVLALGIAQYHYRNGAILLLCKSENFADDMANNGAGWIISCDDCQRRQGNIQDKRWLSMTQSVEMPPDLFKVSLYFYFNGLNLSCHAHRV